MITVSLNSLSDVSTADPTSSGVILKESSNNMSSSRRNLSMMNLSMIKKMLHDAILLLKLGEESKKRSTLGASVISDGKKKAVSSMPEADSSPGRD